MAPSSALLLLSCYRLMVMMMVVMNILTQPFCFLLFLCIYTPHLNHSIISATTHTQGLANSSGINREGNYDYTHGYRTNNDISHASSSRKGSGALLSRGRENKHDYYGRRDSDSNLMAVSASRCLPPAEVLAAHVRLELWYV